MLSILLASAAATSVSAAQAFDPTPWLADLHQAREAIESRYANLEWLEQEREVKIEPLFADLEDRLAVARSESEAKAVFGRLERKIADGHFRIDWPERPQPAPAQARKAPQSDLCSSIGYDSRQNGPGTAYAFDGYRPLPAAGNVLDSGTVRSGGAAVGVVRIGVFQPHGYPQLCRDAIAALSVPQDKPCDEACQNKIVTWAYRRLGESLEQRLGQLKQAGAEVLLVDITNNGGGSEWAEVAARMLTPRLLESARHGFVRGDHWAKQWRALSERLRGHADTASTEDRQRLLGWASEAEAAALQADTPCIPARASCSNVVSAGHSTGLVGKAQSGAFAGKDWGVHVFNPAQHYYRDGIWSGPLVVLVDQETWSAAEQFAALLQDNRAAVILGARTGGAGCGYTWGGHPTKLKNSGAVLKLPDCVRFRADGSNEVRGVIPDELVAVRASDGSAFRANMVARKLPAAIERARALAAAR